MVKQAAELYHSLVTRVKWG